MAAHAAIEQGAAALAVGDWQLARSSFEEAVQESGSAESLAGLGDALFFLGDVRAAVRHRERAYAVSRRAGDVEAAADSAIWLCLTYGMAVGNEVAARGWHARTQSVLAGIEAILPRAWLEFEAAILSSDTRRSLELLDRSLTAARALGDRDLELCALAERGVARVKLGDIETGLSDVDEAMVGVTAGEPSSFFTVVMSACSMMMACDITGDINRATIWSDAADALTEHRSCPYLFVECRVAHGRILTLTGRWAEAESELTRAIPLSRGVFAGAYGRTIAGLAELRLRQGRLEEAQALIEAAGAPVQTAIAAAGLAMRRGEASIAIALVDRWLNAVAVAVPMHAGDHGLSIEAAAALGIKVEALLALDERQKATDVVHVLEQRRTSNGCSANEAQAALARGRLTMDPMEAVRCCEHALELFEALNLPFEAARTRLELARTLSRSSLPLAIAEARAALASFDQLGASGDADLAAELLREWGVSGRYVARATARLTRREEEVLALLAEGLTNPEIAGRLHITRKTVAHHVSNVLSKLGARNRSQAIGYAARTGLVGNGLDADTGRVAPSAG